ncbi:MAG: CPBP family glutamic-type intramembrane protease [Candidatus Lokiarchaeia archaeon]|nr:CPBP family glutamic-type intramembrane protease [Candidatus Lokiarchaeia archaeon]
MSKGNQKKIKYCVFCGADVTESKTYCPNCGKLIIKIAPGKNISKPQPILEKEVSRTCPNCKSIITSEILDQCPICNAKLEKISEIRKGTVQKKPGLIFTNKKLEPEQKFILRKDTWNLKEGLNVFGTCLYILIIVFFLLATFSYQLQSAPLSIEQLLLSYIPELLFGIYPLWYIYNKKHSFTKLGFRSESKKIPLTLIIGILGALMLLLLNFFSDQLIYFLKSLNLDFLNITSWIEENNQVIRNSELLWNILLILSLCGVTISSEIAFRGVLHNTLKQRFKNNYIVILIVASVYSALMLFFTIPYGIYFFLYYFLSYILLGFIYEINQNLYNTIIAGLLNNIISIILLLL